MIDLQEAIARIERAARPLPPRRMALLDACGRRLAAPVARSAWRVRVRTRPMFAVLAAW
jgi:molybdopterin biosynthesis enzyme